jgi:hypothetical protein
VISLVTLDGIASARSDDIEDSSLDVNVRGGR